VHDFDSLFETHASFVWRVLRRYGVPERELPDACQEVFLVVHRKLAEFEARSSVRTWLYSIAQRTALSTRRRARFTRERLEEPPELGSEAVQHEVLERARRLELIEQALQALSEEQREVFALYELEGMTMAEVARALALPENTALYRLYAARDAIREFVSRREGGLVVRMPKRAVSPRASNTRRTS
jgi:RNA polymerase sigma-70 factor (ECF subfamily)